MNGCFDFLGGNTCLWILVILLIICLCKSGCLNGLINSCYCLPIVVFLICCCCKGGGSFFGNRGCGCK